MVPKWLKSYMSSSGHAQIQKAIEIAEKKTSGEIVPMVVRSSATVAHVPFVVLALMLT